jgi:translation initiation factor IF-3
MLNRVLDSISDSAVPEGEPRIEGRHMSVVVVPQKGKGQAPRPEVSNEAEQ